MFVRDSIKFRVDILQRYKFYRIFVLLIKARLDCFYKEKMKIISHHCGELYVMPDTTLLRNNDPYFSPNFATSQGEEVIEGISIKITRLTKCIAQRFASRCWDEFSASKDHRLLGVHHTIGRCFDRSFEVDPQWHTKSELSEEQQNIIDCRIAEVSEYIQLRIGDYIFISNGELKR